MSEPCLRESIASLGEYLCWCMEEYGSRIYVRERPAALQGPRQVINFIEGAGATITVADNAVTEEIDVTIAAAGGPPGAHAVTHEPAGVDEVNDIDILNTGVNLSGHEARHVLGGADDIDAALDARAVALAAQGEIPYRAAAANTLAGLAPGVAGQALLTQGAGANPIYGAPAPAGHSASHEPAGADEVNDIDIGNTGVLLSGHEARHVLGGADDIDSALDARAVALANQGEIVFRAAAANTLSALATGVAGQALVTGGAGADPSWAAPAPAGHAASHEPAGADEVNDIDIGNTGVLLSAHEARHVQGGADDIDSALDARAIALANQGDIVYRAAGANTLAALAPGVAGQFLRTAGAGANPAWAAVPAGVSASSTVTIAAGSTSQLWNHAQNTSDVCATPTSEPTKLWWLSIDDVNNITMHIASADLTTAHTFRVLVF